MMDTALEMDEKTSAVISTLMRGVTDSEHTVELAQSRYQSEVLYALIRVTRAVAPHAAEIRMQRSAHGGQLMLLSIVDLNGEKIATPFDGDRDDTLAILISRIEDNSEALVTEDDRADGYVYLPIEATVNAHDQYLVMRNDGYIFTGAQTLLAADRHAELLRSLLGEETYKVDVYENSNGRAGEKIIRAGTPLTP